MGLEEVVRGGAENGSKLGEAEMVEVAEKHTQVVVGVMVMVEASNELVVAVVRVVMVEVANILHMVVEKEEEAVLCMEVVMGVVEKEEAVLCMEVVENGQVVVGNARVAVAVMRMDR